MLNSVKWLLLLGLWIYIMMRAYLVPITHDEAYSFLLVKTNYINALAGTANTHWLNSLGMKIGSLLLGDQPWQLRLFSIFAWPLYGFSAFKLSNSMQSRIWGMALFIVLVANPFLLDFFGLARGYGLTCAFVLASIWKLTEAVQKEEWQLNDWALSLFFASLAVFSNYTSLYYFLAVVAAFLFFVLMQKKLRMVWPPRLNKWYVLVVGTSVIAIANLLFIKYYTGDLEYGGDDYMVASLLGSLISSSFYGTAGAGVVHTLSYLILLLLICSFVYAAFQFAVHKKITPFTFLALAVLLMLLLNLLFHIFFHTPYLLNRTTLMLYPCVVTLLFFFFDSIRMKEAAKKYMLAGIGLSLALLFAIHFFFVSNVRYSYEWKNQAESKECFDFLTARKARRIMAHEWHYGVLINYYKTTEPGKYPFEAVKINEGDLVSLPADFINQTAHYDYAALLQPFDLQQLKQKGLRFSVVKTYPLTNTVIIQFERSK